MENQREYTLQGIDVSRYQGTIDWEKAAKGKDFAIVRAGYGRYENQADPCLKANIEGAYRAGLKNLGVYWYSYAASEEEARKEAETCIAVIAPYKERLNLPVFFDQEYEPAILAAGRAVRTACCRAFCEKVAAAGYRAGMYGSQDWLQNKIDLSGLPEGTVVWCARYGAEPKVEHTVWQYTSAGKVDGIKGNVDLDRAEASLLPKAEMRWVKTDKGWTYGDYKNRWGWLGGNWYWFDGEGIAVTGWQKVQGVWYYFLNEKDAELTGYKECCCMERADEP